ncbi:putative [Hexamita inflata]|uniref:N(6)-L-threonylcarbamoyladenine synthase n=1 Tax=Hexamita inflata TaxID=28002 RepID=A0AA86TLR5_9EUKA|nr:putative [Hexamita inflata]
MYCLGLEGSANKLGVGITTPEGDILANIRVTYNAPTGQGFLPQEVAKHHRDQILPLIHRALDIAKLQMQQITIIAYTRGPGMGGPLAAVALVAKTLALMFKIPLVPVNHCVAHIEMGRLATKIDNPIVLYASGGNTQIIAYSQRYYRIFGEALDIAVGNCLDRFARDAKIPNDPAPGLNIELNARKWAAKYEIPPLIEDIPVAVKGMDISCSGLNSWLKAYLDKEVFVIVNDEERQEKVNQLCYSLQEYLFAALIEITERAAAHLGIKDFICVGGVGCNERLQEMLGQMAAERGGRVGGMDERYCIDNGAMISWCGWLQYNGGITVEPGEANVSQRWRTDQIEAKWRTD